MGSDSLFDQYDTDNNGEVSPQEWMAVRSLGSHRRRTVRPSSGQGTAFPTARPTPLPTSLSEKVCTLQDNCKKCTGTYTSSFGADGKLRQRFVCGWCPGGRCLMRNSPTYALANGRNEQCVDGVLTACPSKEPTAILSLGVIVGLVSIAMCCVLSASYVLRLWKDIEASRRRVRDSGKYAVKNANGSSQPQSDKEDCSYCSCFGSAVVQIVPEDNAPASAGPGASSRPVRCVRPARK